MSEPVEHLAQIEQAPKRGTCHMSEPVSLFTQIHQAPTTGKCHMSDSVEHLPHIDRAELQLTTLCPPANLRDGKTQVDVVQMSIFKGTKHHAVDDDEYDEKNNGNGNHMKVRELDGAFGENVQEIRGMTLPKPKC